MNQKLEDIGEERRGDKPHVLPVFKFWVRPGICFGSEVEERNSYICLETEHTWIRKMLMFSFLSVQSTLQILEHGPVKELHHVCAHSPAINGCQVGGFLPAPFHNSEDFTGHKSRRLSLNIMLFQSLKLRIKPCTLADSSLCGGVLFGFGR